MSKTYHLVDPELHSLLTTFPQVTLSDSNLGEMRAALNPYFNEQSQSPYSDAESQPRGQVDTKRYSVPGTRDRPPIQLVAYRPTRMADSLPCIYHIHGGGFVMGMVGMMEAQHLELVVALNCAIVSVDYRLAPENPFPVPLHDCLAGFEWVVGNSKLLGIDPKNVGIMGESAGGGLVAGLALLLRDCKNVLPSFQHLIYPMLDDRTCVTPEPNPYAGEFGWHHDNNRYGWASYLGTEPGSDGISQYAAPGRASDLSGLPPTYISSGTLDLFVDENISYAQRLARAGVPVELHVYPGAFHGFYMSPDAQVARRARDESTAVLARALRPGSQSSS